MKQDTRDLGMAGTVWVIAAVAVLALGRVDVPAGLIAGHDDGAPSARPIEATVPPADHVRDPGHGWQEQEQAVADRVPSAEAIPLLHLPADDKHGGSEPRAAVSLAEGHPWPTAATHVTSMGGGPASGHDAATDPGAAGGSVVTHLSEAKPKPQPQPTEAKPQPQPTEAKPQPQPAEAKPKPKPQPKPAEAKPKPQPKPQPAEAKPKPQPAEAKSKRDRP